MKKYQKPVLDAVEYEVEEILTVSGGLEDGGEGGEIGDNDTRPWNSAWSNL